MIGRLRGEVLETGSGMVLVEVAGVGYEVLVPESVMVQMPKAGEAVDLRIRQVFREDGVSLYGFLEPFQRRLFDLLREVKGCGPRIALALLGQVGEHDVMNAILVQDPRILSRATGVGAKLAERIILELKSKVQEEALLQKVDVQAAVRVGGNQAHSDDELIDALLALGYRRPEAESAADKARTQADAVEDQIRIALRSLKR